MLGSGEGVAKKLCGIATRISKVRSFEVNLILISHSQGFGNSKVNCQRILLGCTAARQNCRTIVPELTRAGQRHLALPAGRRPPEYRDLAAAGRNCRCRQHPESLETLPRVPATMADRVRVQPDCAESN